MSFYINFIGAHAHAQLLPKGEVNNLNMVISEPKNQSHTHCYIVVKSSTKHVRRWVRFSHLYVAVVQGRDELLLLL